MSCSGVYLVQIRSIWKWGWGAVSAVSGKEQVGWEGKQDEVQAESEEVRS